MPQASNPRRGITLREPQARGQGPGRGRPCGRWAPIFASLPGFSTVFLVFPCAVFCPGHNTNRVSPSAAPAGSRGQLVLLGGQGAEDEGHLPHPEHVQHRCHPAVRHRRDLVPGGRRRAHQEGVSAGHGEWQAGPGSGEAGPAQPRQPPKSCRRECLLHLRFFSS